MQTLTYLCTVKRVRNGPCSGKTWLQSFMRVCIIITLLKPPSPRVMTEWNFIEGLLSDSLLGDFKLFSTQTS